MALGYPFRPGCQQLPRCCPAGPSAGRCLDGIGGLGGLPFCSRHSPFRLSTSPLGGPGVVARLRHFHFPLCTSAVLPRVLWIVSNICASALFYLTNVSGPSQYCLSTASPIGLGRATVSRRRGRTQHPSGDSSVCIVAFLVPTAVGVSTPSAGTS